MLKKFDCANTASLTYVNLDNVEFVYSYDLHPEYTVIKLISGDKLIVKESLETTIRILNDSR